MTFGSVFGRTFSPTFQPSSQAAKAGGIVVYDEFTDTDNTALSSHTPNLTYSGGWSSTNVSISGNKAKSSGYGVARIETGLADCKISATLNGPATGGEVYKNRAITVRYGLTYNTCWHIDLKQDVTKGFRIIEQVGAGAGDYYIRAESTFTVNINTDYFVEVTLSGSTISAVCNGTTVSYNSAELNQASTSHGMRLFTNQTLDNFKVESI